ncbi:hypothetical protein K501DRAFT_278530 [Backusella circina FSU 941]|nr:hypothetical protein K501DRAFT_278530 [Backusella circina FSU 941]
MNRETASTKMGIRYRGIYRKLTEKEIDSAASIQNVNLNIGTKSAVNASQLHFDGAKVRHSCLRNNMPETSAKQEKNRRTGRPSKHYFTFQHTRAIIKIYKEDKYSSCNTIRSKLLDEYPKLRGMNHKAVKYHICKHWEEIWNTMVYRKNRQSCTKGLTDMYANYARKMYSDNPKLLKFNFYNTVIKEFPKFNIPPLLLGCYLTEK